MRLEVAGAQITEAVVGIIDMLQNDLGASENYVNTLDEISRFLLVDIDLAEERSDSKILEWIRCLQMIRKDISTLSAPGDADEAENDIPVIKI